MKSEYEYVTSISEELSKHSGKWISVVGEDIVAIDKDAQVVYQKAREKYPDECPFVMKVFEGRMIPTVIR